MEIYTTIIVAFEVNKLSERIQKFHNVFKSQFTLQFGADKIQEDVET